MRMWFLWAGPWRIAWSVKIPVLRPALLLALIFSVIGSFQLFNEPQLLQRLAPNVIDSAYTPNLYAYSLAFTSQDLNYAAAVSFLLGLVIVAVSYTVQLAAYRADVGGDVTATAGTVRYGRCPAESATDPRDVGVPNLFHAAAVLACRGVDEDDR